MSDRIRLNGTGAEAREEKLRRQVAEARDTTDVLLWLLLIVGSLGALGWLLWLLGVLR